jgi:hypothetical protein
MPFYLKEVAMNLKRYARFAAPVLMAGLLAACASLIGPRQVDLPQERLQTSLDRKFPMHQRALGVFEVELSHPQLSILPENDRWRWVDLGVTPLLARSRGVAACACPAACAWIARAMRSTSPTRMWTVLTWITWTRASARN